MRQISALMRLGAAIGTMAPLGAAGRVEPIQAQNQTPPPEGFRIIGNIYWVGGEYGSYLITTPQGHILHDTGTNEMHDVIVSNVRKLGFDVKDIKVIISSHAHFDHVQGHAAMKRLTGAQVIALGGDAAALEAGQDNSAGGFRGMMAVHVDRVIKDGDTIALGGVTLRALWVPGHTQGATVWITTVQGVGCKRRKVIRRESPRSGGATEKNSFGKTLARVKVHRTPLCNSPSERQPPLTWTEAQPFTFNRRDRLGDSCTSTSARPEPIE